jgi:hypothetical protein
MRVSGKVGKFLPYSERYLRGTVLPTTVDFAIPPRVCHVKSIIATTIPVNIHADVIVDY